MTKKRSKKIAASKATKLIDDFEQIDNSGSEEFVKFLNKKQRELITSSVDYNLESLSQLISNRTIDLSPKYQRRFRWDDDRKSKLIESFLMNVPIPPIFLNEDNYGKYSVIDGKQRLSAINDFLIGKFVMSGLQVFNDLNGFSFNDLPTEFQSSLKLRANVRAIIILRQSTKDIKYEVFQRLNTGGVKLNAQEIRNSAFPGTLNDKIIELSESKYFHKLLGIKSRTDSRLYQEMQDAELVLRFFSLRESWENYSGGLKKILDSYSDEHKRMPKDSVTEIAKEFVETLEKVEAIFGDDGCFRRWIPAKNKWKQQISAPLYDAQMFACYKRSKQKLVANKTEIMKQFKKLFTSDRTFLSSIESSTASPERFLYRIQTLDQLIKAIL